MATRESFIAKGKNLNNETIVAAIGAGIMVLCCFWWSNSRQWIDLIEGVPRLCFLLFFTGLILKGTSGVKKMGVIGLIGMILSFLQMCWMQIDVGLLERNTGFGLWLKEYYGIISRILGWGVSCSWIIFFVMFFNKIKGGLAIGNTIKPLTVITIVLEGLRLLLIGFSFFFIRYADGIYSNEEVGDFASILSILSSIVVVLNYIFRMVFFITLRHILPSLQSEQ